MTEGTEKRDEITGFITEYGSTITIFTRDPDTGDYGGYEPGSDNEDSGIESKGIPNSSIVSESGIKLGKLKEGEVNLLIRYSDEINSESRITFNSENYDIDEIKEIILQDVVIAKRLKLSRRLD